MWTEWCTTDILYPVERVLPFHFQMKVFKEFHSNQITVEFHIQMCMRTRQKWISTVLYRSHAHYTQQHFIISHTERKIMSYSCLFSRWQMATPFYVMISEMILAFPLAAKSASNGILVGKKIPQQEQPRVLLNMLDNQSCFGLLLISSKKALLIGECLGLDGLWY